MRRFLLPATALVLVVTACGAGAKPAPRLAEAAARQPTVRTIIRIAQEEVTPRPQFRR